MILILLLCQVLLASAGYVCNDVLYRNETRPTADFLFLLDTSGSMDGEIEGLRLGLLDFVANTTAAGIDARYAIISFGGMPRIFLPFTVRLYHSRRVLNMRRTISQI